MEAQAAPARTPPRPSRSQLKWQICQAIQALTKKGVPPSWQSWDAEKTRQFIEAVQGCHTGRSLPQLLVSSRLVIEAYGRDPREILPEGDLS